MRMPGAAPPRPLPMDEGGGGGGRGGADDDHGTRRGSGRQGEEEEEGELSPECEGVRSPHRMLRRLWIEYTTQHLPQHPTHAGKHGNWRSTSRPEGPCCACTRSGGPRWCTRLARRARTKRSGEGEGVKRMPNPPAIAIYISTTCLFTSNRVHIAVQGPALCNLQI
jgi:hypothetical protein